MQTKSFFVESVIIAEEKGLSVTVDLEKTTSALNNLIENINAEGFEVINVTPMTSGVGQFAYGLLKPESDIKLFQWFSKKKESKNYSYGFGYSYTSGFIIIAKLIKKN